MKYNNRITANDILCNKQCIFSKIQITVKNDVKIVYSGTLKSFSPNGT